MGCVQAKNITNSPSHHHHQCLEKLKLDNEYVKGGNGGKPVIRKQPGKVDNATGNRRHRHHHHPQDHKDGSSYNEKVEVGDVVNGGGDQQPQQEKTTIISDNISGENNVVKKDETVTNKHIGGYEIVNGWPQWLVDNISEDVLAGLVPKTADSYVKLAKIGHGTYSNVYKARDRESGKIVALKKVRFNTSDKESIKFMAREIVMLQRLDHPNVIKLEGLATSRLQYSLYLVFDFMLSDLTRIINRPGLSLTQSQVKSYMQQLLSGLQHCHERGILHRDIKASNLLIDRNGILKIADFGLANFFPPKQRPLTNRVVTLWYRAPELLMGSTDYGVGIDLWSAGCLLAEMFSGHPLMPGRNEVEQLHKIFKLCGSPPDDYTKKLRLTTSFRTRYIPNYEEVFSAFPSSSFGLLTRLLALDPASRGTAASALQNHYFSASPLACELSGLPVINDDEPTRDKDRKRKKASKPKQSRTNTRQVHQPKENAEQARGDIEPSNEENNADVSMQISQEMGFNMHSQETSSNSINMPSQEISNIESSSASSTSTSTIIKPLLMHGHHHQSMHSPISLSPILCNYIPKRSAVTEGHPNATKNINPNALKSLKDFTLLHASINDIISHRHGINAESSGQLRWSMSTLDFRHLDPEKLSSLYASDKE
ncbi:hypothetical protein FNV43_RR18774 [Rhamnella rubrinervis]|uniref:Protein kinase domain-containing protein n=1 Tax=Rhamnella rubrinervis TaxID=2594499 RepID=A0A8K0E6X9_9ROSA|nr:hypothetical protein FNV43_RR18774 [Rhamnella rubrinervis]